MLLNALFFLAGSVLIYFGAEYFVKGAARIARILKISPFIIGVTFVAFGTSLPELVVSLSAYFKDATDIAVGNIVGSNISNIGLILGIAAIIAPLVVRPHIFKFDLPFNFGVGLLLMFVAFDGLISTIDSIILLAGFIFFLVHYVRKALTQSAAESEESAGYLPKLLPNILISLGGLAALWGGGELFLRAAIFFAHSFGVPEVVIGLSVVAIGTSLPELMTSIIAIRQKEVDIGVGNILGSNVFNVLFVLGVLGAVHPVEILAPDELLGSVIIMLGFIIILYPLLRSGFKLQRIEGALLLAAYVTYVAYLFLSATSGDGGASVIEQNMQNIWNVKT
jgi:cation:H+ antiporter